MATIVHCLYCFETLASHLQGRESLTLAEVQESWTEYAKSLGADRDTGDSAARQAKRLPALQRLASTSSPPSSSSASSGTCSPSTSTSTAASSTFSLANGADTPDTSVSSLAAPPPPEHPLFITWNTVSARYGHDLRGCIGTFEPKELEEGLSTYALTSALHDMRFSPISARELASLEVAVTLLTDFEDAADPEDWELGTHGLRLSFYYNGKRYGSTYLPDVATDQGWDKEETLVNLMRKAGWVGRRNKWRDVDLKVVRYQGKKESVEYAEYKAWRDWVESHAEK